VHELPLNGRMLLDLALTVPGSHQGPTAAQTGDMNPLYWRPGQGSSLTIGGKPAERELLSGRWSHQPPILLSTRRTLVFPPDAVREFQVQTGSYSAGKWGERVAAK